MKDLILKYLQQPSSFEASMNCIKTIELTKYRMAKMNEVL